MKEESPGEWCGKVLEKCAAEKLLEQLLERGVESVGKVVLEVLEKCAAEKSLEQLLERGVESVGKVVLEVVQSLIKMFSSAAIIWGEMLAIFFVPDCVAGKLHLHIVGGHMAIFLLVIYKYEISG